MTTLQAIKTNIGRQRRHRLVSRWEIAPVGSSAPWSPPSVTDHSNIQCSDLDGRPT